MARELDHASDADLTDPLSDVTIYICVGVALEK